jgi:hypothetical protein
VCDRLFQQPNEIFARGRRKLFGIDLSVVVRIGRFEAGLDDGEVLVLS